MFVVEETKYIKDIICSCSFVGLLMLFHNNKNSQRFETQQQRAHIK